MSARGQGRPSGRSPRASAPPDTVAADAGRRPPPVVSRVQVAVGILLVVAFVARVTTLRRVAMPSGEVVYHHLEWDEMVFTTLLEQVEKNFFNYSLQGTALLNQLTPGNYDYPIFFHPPAFVYTARLLSFLPLPIVPVLMSVATIALVFFVGCRVYDEERGLWAALLLALCPVTWFVSQKIWLDNMLILMATASIAAAIWAADAPSLWRYAIAGGVFGVGFLTKAIMPIMLVPVAVLVWQRDGRDLARKAVAFALPAAAMAGTWQWTLYAFNGQWLPSAYPDADMMARFPFVADVVRRPWHFYLTNLVTITPVYLLALGAARRRQPRELALGLWVLVFFGALTVFGLRGGGYQSRYVAPAYPALALLSAEPIPRFRVAGLIGVVGLVGYGMCHALLYAVLDSPHAADFQVSIAGMAAQLLRDVPKLQ